MKDPIYLFDGSAYIFRAFYATPRLTNADGFPTNALYGFTRMCVKFLKETAPEHAIMVFDAGSKTFRNEMYSEYKANRSECPEDLSVQMPHFRTISRALGFPVVELPGFEADDVIGTLTESLKAHDYDVVIVSADKDLMQLVTKQVTMWDTMRDKRYDPEGVKEKLGVFPEKVIDYLAIAGDSSDNIPGLRGAGPKTAIQLIENYGSVEEIILAADTIAEDKSIRSRKKIAEKLSTDTDLLRLSKELVTVKLDAPVIFSTDEFGTEVSEEFRADEAQAESFSPHLSNVWSAAHLVGLLRYQGTQKDDLTAVAQEFGFESLVEEFELEQKLSAVKNFEQNYHLVLRKDFEEWAKQFQEQRVYAFDLETTSLDIHEAQIVGFACCWEDHEAYYVPCGHDEKSEEQVSVEELLDVLRVSLEDPNIRKIGQNLKYDNQVFQTHGVKVHGVWLDTMVAAYLLHPDRSGYGLTRLAKDHLRYDMVEFHDVVKGEQLFSAVPLEQALGYAAEDAHITWLLSECFMPKLESAGLQQVCFEVESPLVEVLAAIEHRGMRINLPLLQEMSEQVAEQLAHLELQIHETAGSVFNINSPKQIAEVLFEKLGIPTQGVKKTKTGFSTNQAVLEKLKNLHPVPGLILEYRVLHKLRSTYLESLPKEISSQTGRVHTRLNQTVAATGRLSSSEPNLQNIPIQTELGRKVRRAFLPTEGSSFIAADYSQIELRMLAHLSGDETLTDSFLNGVDIHERTAREVLDIAEDQAVSSHERRIGKTMNFGIVYGMSGFRLAGELGIPVGEGNAYIERYFARYPRVKEYFSSIEESMEKTGEVRTILGRRRVLQEIEQGARDRNFVKRAALNAPLQGSAADLIKLAMLQMERVIRDEKLPLAMVLQVHDELLFEVLDSDEETAKSLQRRVKSEMEGVMSLKVPLLVEVAVGANWEEAHS